MVGTITYVAAHIIVSAHTPSSALRSRRRRPSTSFVIQQALHALDSSLVLSGILQRGITSHHIKRLAESRVGASCLYREWHETDPRDADTPSRNTNDCLGESLSKDPIRM